MRLRSILAVLSLSGLPVLLGAQQASVKVDPPDVHGSRTVEPTTKTAVVRDYLESWKEMRLALDRNRPQGLDQDFVGTALTRLTQTVQQQAALGIHARYRDESHHLQIIFYSPGGVSIQLVDHVSYREQVFDRKGNALGSHRINARYLVVLTPSATRWKVRIMQAGPQA